MPLAPDLPSLDGPTPQRAYIIGHPRGWSTPQISLHDNRMLDYDETYVHYRSPTDPGSSGSPVFDNEWRLIGVHHAGSSSMARLRGKGGVYQANEAIRISAIIDRLSTVGVGSGPVPRT
jgi:V8-like Glu-specific endopeptidase